jgi:hypothetical protein
MNISYIYIYIYINSVIGAIVNIIFHLYVPFVLQGKVEYYVKWKGWSKKYVPPFAIVYSKHKF